MKEQYLNSDVLIFPSLTYENCPMVVIWAFGFGLPVIGSRIGGVTELIEENLTGWLFEPGSEQELKKLVSVNKEKIDEMRNSCLEKAKEYVIDKYMNRLEEIYITWLI